MRLQCQKGHFEVYLHLICRVFYRFMAIRFSAHPFGVVSVVAAQLDLRTRKSKGRGGTRGWVWEGARLPQASPVVGGERAVHGGTRGGRMDGTGIAGAL